MSWLDRQPLFIQVPAGVIIGALIGGIIIFVLEWGTGAL